jgi:hypothetical protein
MSEGVASNDFFSFARDSKIRLRLLRVLCTTWSLSQRLRVKCMTDLQGKQLRCPTAGRARLRRTSSGSTTLVLLREFL